jgi:hypothetical protein
MQRIPFPLESSLDSSRPLSSKWLLNLYAEKQTKDARVEVALKSTPGLSVDATYAPGPIVAMNGDLAGRIYIASGNQFYRQRALVGGGLTTDALGTIGTPATGVLPPASLAVTIAVGPTACVVCVPPNAFTCDHSGALNQITGTFPAGGAAHVAYIDGYFVFKAYDNSAQFFISDALDPSHFTTLAFAFSDALSQPISGIFNLGGEVWMCGEAGWAVWYDAGGADFPLRPRAGGVVQAGVATPQSVARADNSLFWVGIDGIVYRSKGYGASRISNHAIEALIQSLDPTQVIDGLTHTQGGHIFYCFTLSNQTFGYDCATQVWHNRSSTADGLGRWLASASAVRGGVQLIGDYNSGNVYYTNPSSPTENGVVVLRQLITPPLWAIGARAFMARLEIEMEVGGVGPQTNLTLEVSDDGGWSYKTPARTLDAGTFTQRTKRVVATRLGSFRQRVLKITAAGHAVFYAIDADITPAPKDITPPQAQN